MSDTDCQECGACCFSASSAYVPVFSRDFARLGRRAEALTHTEQGKVYLQMRDGRCAALKVVAGTFSCGIYTQRPEACRALARGSSACLEERAAKLKLSRRHLPLLS